MNFWLVGSFFFSLLKKMKLFILIAALILALFFEQSQSRRLSIRTKADDAGCQGRLDLAKFSKVNHVCEECYSLYKEIEVYKMCRYVCIFVGILRASENHNKPGKWRISSSKNLLLHWQAERNEASQCNSVFFWEDILHFSRFVVVFCARSKTTWSFFGGGVVSAVALIRATLMKP